MEADNSSSKRQRRRFFEQHIMAATAIVQIAEEEQVPTHRRGSVVGRQSIRRDRIQGYHRLMNDYFVDRPVYNEAIFRRRFRMCKSMFINICHDVATHNDYFKRRFNAAGVPGFTTIQKVTAAIRMLAYGGAADRLDEYFHMGESTILETVNEFTKTIVSVYAETYLREPNSQDIAKLLAKAEERGFPGMLGSIDCMHWEWEKCPTAWQGQFRGHYKKPTLILEAVASYDTWIWHAFFGMPGSLNDINVLHRSPVFDSLSSGNTPQVNFTVNGCHYDMGYYLADGIYPQWSTLIGPIPSPLSNKHKYFTNKQQQFRKDVERAFGILQAKYQIIKNPARQWSPIDLKYIVDAIVILHNMGIDYERDMDEIRIEEYDGGSYPEMDDNRNVPAIAELIERHQQIESKQAHTKLKMDLIEHVWSLYGSL